MLDQRVHKEQLVRLVLMVTMVLQALKDPQATQVQRGTLDHKVRQGTQALREILGLKDLQVTLVPKAVPELLVPKVHKATQVQLDQQGLPLTMLEHSMV
jgi:hypothetical protein